MSSPFPGMNPYLEQPSLWPDVHLELIRAVRATLAPQVAPRYYVGVEERTYVVAVEPRTYVGRPDVAAIDLSKTPSGTPAGSSPAAVLERPIPEIPIPLRADETEPTLNLGQALAKVYDEVRYDLRIDYTAEPEPPLDPASAAWAHEFLQQAGLRE